MEEIQELAFIVNKNKLRNIELVANFEETDTKMAELYHALVNNKFRDDKEAAIYFYGDTSSNSSYQKLKTSLRRRLVNSLFFIDVKHPSYAARQRAYYESYRSWAAAKILLGKNARKAGIALCLKILKDAKKYEFNELVMDLARTLRLHFGYRVGDVKKFEFYHELYKEYEEIYFEENLAEELYTRSIMEFVKDKSQKTNQHHQALAKYEKLKPIIQHKPTYRTYLYANLIRLIAYSCINDHNKTIEVCDEVIQFFRNKPYKAKVPLQICYFQKLVCYTQLKQFKNGKAAAELALKQLEEGNFNWFKYHENYFILSMHTDKYYEAYEILIRVFDHRRFKFLPSSTQEIWRIFDAYIFYLTEIGLMDATVLKKRKRKFNLGRFLNDTPIFSKDKRGLNIPILIAQILLLIQQSKYDRVIDRFEAIERYCSRYLRKDDTFRSNCFIKMILQIPAAGFHRIGVERKAEKFYKKLVQNPLELSGQSHDIEIIPYENLWSFALNTLDNKFQTVV